MFSQEDLIVTLSDKLLACGIGDSTTRESTLALLPAEIKQGIVKSESATDRTAAVNIVYRVLEFEEGIEQLAYALCQIAGRTEKWHELDRFIQKQFPAVVTYADRKNMLATAKSMEWPAHVLTKAYLSSIPEGWLRPNFYGESDLLAQMLKDLAKIGRLSSDTFPVLEFAERLALYAHEQENEIVRDSLRSWVEWKAFELCLDSVQLERLHEKIRNNSTHHAQKTPYLLIMLDSDGIDTETNSGAGPQKYHVQVWLLDQQYQVVDTGITIDDTPRTLEDIAQLLGYLLEHMLNVESMMDAIDDLVIELLLPDELLTHDFSHWSVTVGDDEFVLGLQHKVVVRSARRATKRLYWPAWRKKWTQLQESFRNESSFESFACICNPEACRVHTSSSSSILVCSREECQARAHLQAALRGSPIVCLALTYTPSCTPIDGTYIFRTLLQTGMPVALWPGEPLTNTEPLASLLSSDALNSLPGKIWEWRKEAIVRGEEYDSAHSLTLLWDDPYRLPPTVTAPPFGVPIKKG